MKKDKLQAIFFIILAGLGFSLMSFFVRLSGDVPTMEKAFFRNLVAAVVAGFTVVKNKTSLNVPKSGRKWLLLRCCFGTVGLIANFYALDHMNIADANMLNKLSPFFAIAASVFILGEMVSPVEWATVAIAFGGALFIIKPSFSMEFLYGLVGAIGGLGAGLAYTCLRKTTTYGVDGKLIVLCFSLFSCLVCTPFMIADFKLMEWWQLGCLLLAGLCATLGQFSITKAYSKAPAKEISVFDYSQIVFAAVLGMLFLNQYPDVFSVIGYVIIIGVAVFKWQYTLKHDV